MFQGQGGFLSRHALVKTHIGSQTTFILPWHMMSIYVSDWYEEDHIVLECIINHS